MTRRLISSGGPWEARAGYSRAVVVGDGCWVSGTTDTGPDGRARHADIGGQTEAVLQTIETALAEAGFSLAEVVRTRMFVTDMEAARAAVIEVHGRVFGEIRPASTLVEVTKLIDPTLLIEIEAEARHG